MQNTFARPSRLYDGYIFDLDGTIYLSNALLPGAKEVIERLRENGRPLVFVSNNPTISREDMATKLSRLGLPVSPDSVINSTVVLVNYLKKEHPGATVFPIGERPLHDALSEGGFTISDDPARIDFVIASFDRTFVYSKLQIAFDAIRAGARFIATNGDRYCPVDGGGEPDAASIIAAVEACTHTNVERILGKPSELMAQTALDHLGLRPADCLLTGDRVEVDIYMGQRAGIPSALTLTGATRLEQLNGSGPRPDFVVDRIDQIIPE